MYTMISLTLLGCLASSFSLAATNIPAAASTRADTGDIKNMEKATFAAGCFWGVEAAFRKVKGVKITTVGYIGGTVLNPSYKRVCQGDSGHAEAVEVIFDPQKVSFDDLLKVFWTCHNPTQLNRQGPDIGTQYRSAIFYHSSEQKKAALASIEALKISAKFKQPIVTQVISAAKFYPAEEYHQQYLEKRGLASCHL